MSMQVRLEVSHNKSNVNRVVLRTDTVIGRGSECNLRVASNQVSRRHCKIIVGDTGVMVRDLGSSNGTFINGEAIPAEQDFPISSGTELSIGPIRFIVRFEAPAAAAIPPGSTVEMPLVDAASAVTGRESESGDGTFDVVEPEPVQDDFNLEEPADAGDAFVFEEAHAGDDEDEYDDDEEAEYEPLEKKRGLRSLFGLLRRRQHSADEEDVDEQEYDEDDEDDDEDDEGEEDSEQQESEHVAAAEAALDEQAVSDEVPAAPDDEAVAPGRLESLPQAADEEPAGGEMSDDEIASFLVDIQTDEETQQASGDDDALGDFLDQLGNDP